MIEFVVFWTDGIIEKSKSFRNFRKAYYFSQEVNGKIKTFVYHGGA